MPTHRRRSLILLHKNTISNKKENNDQSTVITGKGTRKKTISGEALKAQFKNGNIPSN